jgi:hypothetical protein
MSLKEGSISQNYTVLQSKRPYSIQFLLAVPLSGVYANTKVRSYSLYSVQCTASDRQRLERQERAQWGWELQSQRNADTNEEGARREAKKPFTVPEGTATRSVFWGYGQRKRPPRESHPFFQAMNERLSQCAPKENHLLCSRSWNRAQDLLLFSFGSSI